MGGKGKGKGGGKGKGKGSGAPKEPEGPPAIDLPVGTELTAQYSDGEWYKARVMQVRKKAPQVKVYFLGYDDESMAEWLGLDQLRSKLLKGAKEAAAEPQAKAQGKKKAEPKKKAESYDMYEERWFEMPEVGDKCDVLIDDGKFHQAEVLAISMTKMRKANPIKVVLEVWVSPDQLKLKSNAKSEPKGATKGGKGGKGGKGKGKMMPEPEPMEMMKGKGKGKSKGKGKGKDGPPPMKGGPMKGGPPPSKGKGKGKDGPPPSKGKAKGKGKGKGKGKKGM